MDNKKYKEEKEDAQELIDAINDPAIEEEVNSVRRVDPLNSLKLNLFSFFESRLDAIKQEDDFEYRIKTAILSKIENDELSTSQLMQLYGSVKSQGSKSLEVLLDVFKPSQAGNVSPLVEEKKSEDGEQVDGSIDQFKELNPEERDTLHKFSKLVNEMKSTAGKTPEKNEE
jgi:hypothetical protein